MFSLEKSRFEMVWKRQKKEEEKKKSNACGDRCSNVAHTWQWYKPLDQNRRTRSAKRAKIIIYKPMVVIVYCLNLVSKFTPVLVDPGTDTKILVDAATGTGRCGYRYDKYLESTEVPFGT